MMIILGLTGSIGMGKTTAANDFRRLGVPVHDSDAAVHQLLAPDGAAFGAIQMLFPEAIGPEGVDRRRLGDLVFNDPAALKQLEAILHPLVRERKNRFLKIAARQRSRLVVLDIPLLFETGGDRDCDAVVVVTAPAFVQRARVMARTGMTEEKFTAILAKQTPDRIKRRKADFIVQTGLGRLESLSTIRQLIKVVKTWKPRKWPPAGAR